MDGSDFLEEAAKFVPGFLYVFEERRSGAAMPYASPGLYGALGVTPEQVQRDATVGFRHIVLEDQGPLVASINAARSTLRPWMHAFRVDHPEKGLRWLMGRSTPRKLAGGGVRWLGMFQDITEEREVQEGLTAAKRALREQSDRLERFFTLSGDALGTLDAKGRITPLNDGLDGMLGWTPEQLAQDVGQKLFRPSARAAMRDHFQRLLRGEAAINVVSELRAADGSWRWVEWRAQPFDGRHVFFVARDVSARETLRRNLEVAKACAE
ncbi:MAG: PAS domain S-box protein, partial [Pseudomonadota bacterium]